MNTITLDTRGAIEELPRLLEGLTLQRLDAVPHASGASRLVVQMAFTDGVVLSFEAGPLRSIRLTADVELPQFVGAAELPPPKDETFKLRAV
jgi:hypothetical protein